MKLGGRCLISDIVMEGKQKIGQRHGKFRFPERRFCLSKQNYTASNVYTNATPHVFLYLKMFSIFLKSSISPIEENCLSLLFSMNSIPLSTIELLV